MLLENINEYVGGVCRFVNSKLYISQELDEKVLEKLEKYASGAGTINGGSDFIASGLIGNKNGLLIGANSSTIEIQSAVETLEYL